eukprot:GFUD01031234.1.p1 GENE.GFUD01031234.1~~GFUD01031234.1.p1  ORF type:complete len:327 (+),score=76.37 GFUD01031234.1:365-1345(+)
MTYFARTALLFDNNCLNSLIRLQCVSKARVSTSCWKYNSKTFDEKVENQTINRLKEPEPFKNYAKQSENLNHFANTGALVVVKKEEEYTLPHPIWSKGEAEEVEVTHRKPVGLTDNLAYLTVSAMRLGFDIFSGYKVQLRLGTLDERAVLTRCIFLETVAGVPGFAAGMIRHLHSLRKMERDHGWIHTLIEEAENERMHLMTFLQLRHPGPFFRGSVILTQLVFTAAFSLAYVVSPHFCHRFVGYLEEQAVVTYSDILQKMDEGKLPMWSRLPAPEIAAKYWKLEEGAMMRDVILAIRADEAHHRVVNHTLGDMDLKHKNPFGPGE